MSDENVDTRVVELDFDNKKFEKNVKKTQSSLDDLNESLQFDGATEGMDAVIAKFSALDVAAVAVITNITNRVLNLGIQLVKSLSIDQVSAGWTKFGQKTTSVATMASQSIKIAGQEITDYSEKMEAINEQLEKLNWFTDETSYNFTDMVDNIGKFTAAGQDLDASVEAMMGIANWAALSGQNATTASRAMYQLSQALSKGYVQLLDYKSIQNANMDTQEFRQTVLDTAVSLGELTKEGENYITKTGKKFTKNQFTDELSEKWFTSDVLTKSLSKYSAAVDKIYEIAEETGMTASQVMARYGDELDEFGLKAFKASQEARTLSDAINSVKDAVSTGWMNTAEKIFGGYDETKELWTDLANELYDMFASSGDFRNEILGIWKDLGGRADLFEHGGTNQGAFWNIYDAIVSVINTIKSSFNDIFPISAFEDETDKANDLGNKLKTITSRFKEWTAKIKEAVSENSVFANILRTIFSIAKLGLTILNGIKYAIDPIVSVLKTLVSDIFNRISYYLSDLPFMEDIFGKIVEYSNKVADALSIFIDEISQSSVFDNFIGFFKDLFAELANTHIISNLISVIKTFFTALSKNGETAKSFKSIIVSILKIFTSIGQAVLKLVSIFNKYVMPMITKVLNFIASISGGFIGTLVNLVSSIFELIAGLIDFDSLSKKISETLASFNSGDLSLKFKPLSVFFEGLKTLLAGVVTMFKALVPVISSFLTILGKIFKAIGNALATLFAKGTGKGGMISNVLIVSTVALVALVAIIVLFKRTLGSATRLMEGLADVVESFAALLRAKVFMKIAKSMLIMAAAIALLGAINKEQLIAATAVFLVLTAVMVGMLKLFTTMNKGKGEYSQARKNITLVDKLSKALVKMSVSIVLFAVAMKKMGNLSSEQMETAITGVVTAIVGMSTICLVASKLKAKNLASVTALSVLAIGMSASLLVFAAVIGLIGKMSFGNSSSIVKIMAVLATFIASLATLTLIAGKIKTGALTKLAVLSGVSAIFAVVLIPLAAVMTTLSKMSWSGMAVAVVALTAVIAEIVALTVIAGKLKSSALAKFGVMSAIFVVFNAAMIPLAIALKTLSSISWQQMIVAVAGMSATLLAIVALAKLMSVMGVSVVSLAGMAASMVILSVAMIGLATAFMAFSAVSLGDIATGLIAMAGAIIIIAAIDKLIPGITTTMLTMSASFLGISIALLAAAAAFALFTASMSLFASSFEAFIAAFLETMLAHMTEIGELLSQLVNVLLDTLIESTPKIIEALNILLESAFEGLAELLPSILESLCSMVTSILQALVTYIPEWTVLLVEIIVQFLDALTSEMHALVTSLVNFLTSFIVESLEALADCLGPIVNAAIDFILKTIKVLGETFRDRASDFVDTIYEFGVNLIKGLWNGIVTALADMLGNIPWIGGKIKDALMATLDEHSPSKMTYEMGDYLMQGLSNGMTENTDGTVDEATDSFGEVVSAISDTINDGIDDDALTITPVLDLSNVEDGADSISSLMSNINGGSVSTSVKMANSASNGFNSNKAATSNGQNGSTTTNNSSTENYYSTFNITTDDPEEFARQADVLLQKMRLRSNLAKGGA